MSAKQLLLEAAPGSALPGLPVKIGLQAEGRPDFLNPMVAPPVSGLSLRSNFAWALAGNVVYAICQWGMIVALAKLGSSFMIGQFSLGLAIATPVLMFTNLHLRVVQASDARRLYSFGEYLQLRSVMTLGAIAVIGGIVCFEHYERQTAMVILVVALAKGIESLSDIHYGLFQLNDRLDQAGASMMLRGAFSLRCAQRRALRDSRYFLGVRWVGFSLAGGSPSLRLSSGPSLRGVLREVLAAFELEKLMALGESSKRVPASMEPDASGAPSGARDDYGVHQSQHAALLH